MRLGLLADIHEAVDLLQEALEHFHRHQVEEIIFLGDVVRMTERLEETVALMRRAGIVGVWGNHDFGMCQNLDDEVRRDWSAEMLEYTTGLRPWLVRDDVRFSHVEPWLDAHDLMQLWFFDGLPTTAPRLAQSFDAFPERVFMSGHVHQWYLATPEGPLSWAGEEPIRLSPPQRFYLVVHALCAGYCATYDTASGLLTPIRLTGPALQAPAEPNGT